MKNRSWKWLESFLNKLKNVLCNRRPVRELGKTGPAKSREEQSKLCDIVPPAQDHTAPEDSL